MGIWKAVFLFMRGFLAERASPCRFPPQPDDSPQRPIRRRMTLSGCTGVLVHKSGPDFGVTADGINIVER